MKKTMYVLMLLFAFGFESTAQLVTLYTDCNYGGKSQYFGVGRYKLTGTRIGAYNLSSMKIPNGLKVVLYTGYEPGQGSKTRYSSNVVCLEKEWNDKAVSMVIEKDDDNNSGNNSGGNYYGRGVTLYTDCDYRGQSKTLTEGNYDSWQLGIGNDKLSSFRVPSGWRITLYSEGGYRGNSDSWSGDVNCLNNYWNDKTSSIRIYRDGSSGGGNNNNRGSQVTLYSDCGYSGNNLSFSAGRFNKSQLGVIGSDQLSSIRIPRGMSITIWENESFSGRSATYTSSIECLPSNWNDKMTSFEVKNTGSYGNNNNNSAVILYEDCDFRGPSKTIYGTGYYNMAKLGIRNDQLSSFKLPVGYQITIYEDDNFRGRSTTIPYDVQCLSSEWNDKCSSIYISKQR